MDRENGIFVDINSLMHTAGSMRQVLQTLLSSVDAMTDRMDPDSPEGIRDSSAALRSIYRLIRLSENLSAFALLEKNSYPLCKVRRSVFSLVRGIAEQAAELLAYRNVSLEIVLPDRDFFGAVDQNLLRLMLWNLLANAAEHASDGKLTLRAERSGQEEILLYLTNRTEGPELLETERLFDRYSRDPEDPHARDGLGVGLRLVLDAAALHGGSLLLSSTPEGIVTAMLRLRTEKDADQKISSPVGLPEQTLNEGLIGLSCVLPDEAFDPRDLL